MQRRHLPNVTPKCVPGACHPTSDLPTFPLCHQPLGCIEIEPERTTVENNFSVFCIQSCPSRRRSVPPLPWGQTGLPSWKTHLIPVPFALAVLQHLGSPLINQPMEPTWTKTGRGLPEEDLTPYKGTYQFYVRFGPFKTRRCEKVAAGTPSVLPFPSPTTPSLA